jgi:hypothetical protein
MNFLSFSTSQQRHPPDPAIPYSVEAMRQDLHRIRIVWADCQTNRDRDAIYAYLAAVYGLVAWWAAEGREDDRACTAICLQRLDAFDREDPYASVIRCTADLAKVDKRTRSKWSRVMRYAHRYKSDSEPLDQFIRRGGGINECAARYTERLGRHAVKATEKTLRPGGSVCRFVTRRTEQELKHLSGRRRARPVKRRRCI